MKTLLVFFIPVIFLLVFISCGRDPIPTDPNPPTPNPPVNPTSDTLSTGWKVIPFVDSTLIDDIFFIRDTGYLLTSNKIYRSIDAGETWQHRFTPRDGWFTNIGMGNNLNAVFIDRADKELVVTNDGGQTFKELTLANENRPTDVFFINDSVAYVCGRYFWKTNDAGKSWTKISDFYPTSESGERFIFFLDEKTGWFTDTESGIYKTLDGGVSWHLTVSDSTATRTKDFFSIFMLSNGKGFSATRDNLSITTDKGDTWNSYRPFSSKHYHDVHFIDDNTGYYTDGRYILKTIDGGTTWNKDVSMHSENLVELHFTDANHGWACGSRGTILKYTR